MNANNTGNVIFKAKTKEAFVIKIIGELLSNTLSFSQFLISDKGIFLLQSDDHRKLLIDVSLYKETFMMYKCTKPINFLINSVKFYKLLKNIKKKDSITITITETLADESLALGICVEQSDNNNKLTTNIRISYYQPEVIDAPKGYENPVIMSGKEFQSIKNLHHSSETMHITSKGEYIKFSVFDDDRHDRKLEVGNETGDENNDFESHTRSFKTSYMTSLCKCAGQSGNIQVFLNEELPLKIKLKAGNLGDISVYIKSFEMIAEEEDDEYVSKSTTSSVPEIEPTNAAIPEQISVKKQSKQKSNLR